jgi:DNA polymerase-3 subunit alpha
MSFVHLHLHTEYSLLDGLNRVKPLFEKVKKSGMDAIAITDHGVMYGATEFWTYAQEYGIKPIMGCEIYLAPTSRTVRQPINGIKYYHLLLLAKNKKGYENLNKIVSIGHLEGLYYKPRVDLETLAKYSEGLICTSACLAGPISRHITRGEEAKAQEWMQALSAIFKEDFYLEIQRNGFKNTDQWQDDFAHGLSADEVQTIKEQMQVNAKLKDWSYDNKLKLITTTDAHYLDQQDKETQEILFAIKDGKKLSEPKRRRGYVDTYVKTPEEMFAHFQDLPEVLTSTLEVSEKIESYNLGYDRIQPRYIPDSKVEAKKDAKTILREQVYAGSKVQYGELSTELKDRIEYELGVIDQKGYNDYFLVVSDIIGWARKQGIVVGVRGSVAGSAVAYCLDIINVEPIAWELYFERFLNPERPSPPDIDMDFQDDRRDEVVAYVEQKYGKDNVAAICAIGRMKTKAAIRDVARVMEVDLKIADTLSKKVHVLFGKVKKIDDMMKDDPEFAEIINSDSRLGVLRDTVAKIEGMARHVSTHACGYLITPEPIINYVSVQFEAGKVNSTKRVTQQEGSWIESLGLMKFDFLGLRNLTIIKNTIDLIEKYHGVRIDIKKIPLDDKKTFQLFSNGETIGVFQFESPPMQKYLHDLQPENLEDLCFMVSAYRPGPMKYIPEYIDCRHGRSKPQYLIPEMEPILQKTYGFAIYQEQVIKIAVDIAGYSMGAADLLRRAMGKKKIDIMKKEEAVFKKGIAKFGYDEKIAAQLWEYLLPFADYGFNKAHGASYALIAYWCAYLKANYPIEFIAGLMHSDIDDTERISVDMEEARRMGYTILPPDINKSEIYFSIERGKFIRYGLGAVKNVGMKLVEEIVNERIANSEFKGIDDFLERMIAHKVNKKSAECLTMVGAFDKFGYRNQLLAVLENAFDRAQKALKSKEMGQQDLFGVSTNSDNQEIDMSQGRALPDLQDIDNSQKIAWEKELLGSYITAHPLDAYSLITLNGGVSPLSKLYQDKLMQMFKKEQEYKFLALISAKKIVLTKAGNEPMAILELEDQLCKMNAVVFPKTFKNLKDKLDTGEVFIFMTNVSIRDGAYNLIINDLIPAKEGHNAEQVSMDLTGIFDKQKLAEISTHIKRYKGGNLRLNVIYGERNNPKRFSTTIEPKPEVMEVLRSYMV